MSRKTEVAVVMCVGSALSALTAAIVVSGSSSEYAALEALARASSVGVPIAVGLYARHRAPFERFGGLLMIGGLLWFLASLSASPEALPYSIGRAATWFAEVWFIYLVLAFPSGRLRGRIDRGLVEAGLLLAALLYLPSALLVDGYPAPSPWSTCVDDCPSNAFMVVDSEPAFVEDIVRPLREALSVLLFIGVLVRLADRLRRASPPLRRRLGPVLTVAIVRLVIYAAAFGARRIEPDSPVVEVGTELLLLTIPGTALAFLVGLVRGRLFIAGALQHLAGRLRGHPSPEDLRVALAEAFDDPSLRIVYWLQDGREHWADADGQVVAPPSAAAGRSYTEVLDGDQRIAAIIHDPALDEERAFVDGATSYAVMTLENHRLAAQASSLLIEVNASRARIEATADDERRRIERDLHDGAQQRLVALRIRLKLAAEQDGDSAPMLDAFGGEVEEALDELRSLARGIHPPLLAARGLEDALRVTALQVPLPCALVASRVGRYPADIESTVYFCCLEALQNTAKHARTATSVQIVLSEHGGKLHLEVRDDGAGFATDAVTRGAGMANMRDRLSAVGGSLAIRSGLGLGTRVSATIPLAVARIARS